MTHDSQILAIDRAPVLLSFCHRIRGKMAVYLRRPMSSTTRTTSFRTCSRGRTVLWLFIAETSRTTRTFCKWHQRWVIFSYWTNSTSASGSFHMWRTHRRGDQKMSQICGQTNRTYVFWGVKNYTNVVGVIHTQWCIFLGQEVRESRAFNIPPQCAFPLSVWAAHNHTFSRNLHHRVYGRPHLICCTEHGTRFRPEASRDDIGVRGESANDLWRERLV